MARVLVADDDRGVRKVLRRTLEKRGHTVGQAADGREALEMLGRDIYDLLVLDLNMPGVGGPDALRLLRKDSPELRVIVISGFIRAESDKAAELINDFAVCRVVEKPFSMETVAEVVDECLR